MSPLADATLAIVTIADVLALAGFTPPANERRAILCPLHAERTPSFQIQRSSRGYRCHGCGAHGGIFELVVRLGLARDRAGALELLASRYGIASDDAAAPRYTRRAIRSTPPRLPPAKIERTIDVDRVRAVVAGCVPIAETPADAYLRARGITIRAPHDARYHSCFNGRPGIVFGLRDDRGRVVGAQARHLDDRTPKATSCGSISAGVYATSSAALLAKVVAVTEAPIDALSISFATRVPAIALCGVAMRDWLRLRALGRTFLIATDSDAAGDRAAVKLAALLEPLGGRCLRIAFGARKDANDMLLVDGAEALRSIIFETSRIK